MTSPSVQLTGLNVYPIKSAAGIPVTEWELDDFGLRLDRRWMVVDRQGRFLTQRTHPRLALLQPRLEGATLRVEAEGTAPLELPLEPREGVPTSVRVWKDECEALDAGGHAARWLTAVLDIECSLVYLPPETVRPANPAYAPPGTRVSFADAYPLLLISEESLADLNGRMATPVPMNRFRPNLVVRGGGAFFEDRMSTLRTNGLELRVVKPCDRCVLTTVDQATGQRGVEPLRTLATYRKYEGEVYFGQNVVHVGRGKLRVGQRFEWTERRDGGTAGRREGGTAVRRDGGTAGRRDGGSAKRTSSRAQRGILPGNGSNQARQDPSPSLRSGSG